MRLLLFLLLLQLTHHPTLLLLLLLSLLLLLLLLFIYLALCILVQTLGPLWGPRVRGLYSVYSPVGPIFMFL